MTKTSQKILEKAGNFNLSSSESNNPLINKEARLNFDNIDFEISRFPVGFYKASEPLHLKTDIFVLNLKESLDIKLKQNSCKLYDYYGKRGQDSKKVQIIYKYLEGANLPSVYQVASFRNLCFSEEAGLIKNYRKDKKSISFLEYRYINLPDLIFDKENFLFDLEELGNDKKPNNNEFVNISSDSQRFNEIKSLAKNITKEVNGKLRKAKKIEEYLRNNYSYTLTPNIKDQSNPIDDFILDTKKGYCTYFAAAMSTMLEALQIKSRVVGGFYASEYNSKLEAYLILNTNLHAWVEVFSDKHGWITFDPTSSRQSHKNKEDKFINSLDLPEKKDEYELLNQDLKFSDLFLSKEVDLIQDLENSISFNRNANNSFQKERKKNLEQQIKKEKKRKEKIKKEKKELRWIIKRTIRYSLYSLFVLLGLFLAFVFSYYVFHRIKNPKYYKRLRDRKLAKIADREIRLKYIKKLNLKEDYFLSSSKEFLEKLEKNGESTDELKEFYETFNKVLFAEKYTREDLVKIENFIHNLKSNI